MKTLMNFSRLSKISSFCINKQKSKHVETRSADVMQFQFVKFSKSHIRARTSLLRIVNTKKKEKGNKQQIKVGKKTGKKVLGIRFSLVVIHVYDAYTNANTGAGFSAKCA